MTTEAYAWRKVRATGLTGTDSIYLIPFKFGDGSHPTPAALVRMGIELVALALASNDLGTTYPTYYSNEFILSYAPGSPGTCSIVATKTPFAGVSSDLTWNPVAGAIGSDSFAIRVDAQATTKTFTIGLAARVKYWLER